MTIEEFHQEMMSTVRSSAEATKDFVRTSFVKHVSSLLVDAEEVTDFVEAQFEGVGLRKRRLQVDGYSIDEADGTIALMVAEFHNDDQIQSFSASEAKRGFSALKAFVEEALKGNLTNGSIEESAPGYGLAHELLERQSSVVRFRFYIVSDAQLTTRVQEWDEDEIFGIPVEFHIWDVARFHRAYESVSGRDELNVAFRSGTLDGLPYISAGTVEGEYNAYLCVIPGAILADIYNRYGSRLLEGNVRAFLSTKGKVNAGMQITLQDAPEMFFAYNNGVAATAEAIEVSGDGIPRIISALNLQIVNGGQTTASVALAQRSGIDLSRVRVPMKLSVLSADKSATLIPKIAKFANSQNKVSDADFFANHPYHIRIEAISRKIWTPPPVGMQHGSHWFYERARGQYVNEQAGLTKSQKTVFLLQNPKSQLLTKTDVAKFENTWRGLPHKVSLGAQKNFLAFAEWVTKEWSADEQQFDEAYFRYLVALAILFKHTEFLVSKQAWYQGGYRANIVTYALAKLQFSVLQRGKDARIPLEQIWDTQSVPIELSDLIAKIAYSVFKVLTHPMRPKDNVTEWAKMPTCWIKVQEEEVDFDEAILETAFDPELEKARQDVAAGIIPSGFGMFARVSVTNVEGSEWEKMRKWGVEQGLLTLKESDLLRAASRIPKFVPSAKDCEKILKIKNKLLSRGFGGNENETAAA